MTKPHPITTLPRHRAIRKAIVKLTRVRVNLARSFPHLIIAHYPETADTLAHTTHGRNFFSKMARKVVKGRNGRTYQSRRTQSTFESRFVLSVIAKTTHLGKTEKKSIASMSLGFSKDSVIVEAMQTKKGTNNLLNEFRRASKRQALDFVLKEVEQRAKELGFLEVKIRRPETLAFFDRPVVGKRNATPFERAEIRKNIMRLYNTIASRNGYRKENLFFVKKL